VPEDIVTVKQIASAAVSENEPADCRKTELMCRRIISETGLKIVLICTCERSLEFRAVFL
jgi:hypothetical protein